MKEKTDGFILRLYNIDINMTRVVEQLSVPCVN